MLSFLGLNVVVTGGSYGLGRAIAIEFSRRGSNVAICSRKEEKLQETLSLMTNPEKHLFFPLDLCSTTQIRDFAGFLSHKFKKVDVLINNAAGWYTGKLVEMSDEEIANMISSTVTGPILLHKYLTPLIELSDRKTVVNVLSTAALPSKSIDPSVASIPFYAAKWGQAGYSEASKGEYRDWKITSFYPGGFDTDSTIDELQEDVEKRSPGTLGVREIAMSILDIVSKPGSVHIGSIVIQGKSSL